MTKGVFLTAYGKRGYVWSAYNFAFSIKYFNPHIKITLYHDDSLYREVSPDRIWVFDTLIPIPDEVKYTHGKIDPGKIKVSVYELLPYDYTLYLDVDALALKDLAPIFDDLIKEGGYYYTTVIGTHNIKEGKDIGLKMIWADADVIWEHYKLPEDAVMPCTNSSFQFIKKCKESEALFKQVKENQNVNPIPLSKLKTQWGGGYPDELSLNIALAQKGIIGKTNRDYLFLGYHLSEKTFEEITNDNYILSVFGGRNFTRLRYTEWYERLLHQYHRSQGLSHIYKHHLIINDKHANTRPTQIEPSVRLSQGESLNEGLIRGKIPVEKTILINTSGLISEYRGNKGRPIHITNWTNPSMIEYHGERFFVYRMEAKPFCVSTRLGMCKLDENYQPTEEQVLLELHSELWNYGKNFHVEDPRLFIYQDKLYLSYTDGYTMGQAEIDPVTMQAKESFYLSKPDPKRTEKNWVFFEHGKDLLCVYDFQKMEIFKMNGMDYEKISENPSEYSWDYGEIRGGTSPIRIGNKYMTFFHSSKMVRRKGRAHKQYFMGALEFDAKTFKVLRISKEPIVSAPEISDRIPRFNNQIFVVFPGGVIRKDKSWMVAYGENDTYSKIVEVSDELLMDNLTAVKQKELEPA